MEQNAWQNVDEHVTAGFGDEWARFDQRSMSSTEREAIFNEYFSMFPWDVLPQEAVGADFGCGSGRWAAVVAARVGQLYCVDASDQALEVARINLAAMDNCLLIHASVDEMPVDDASLDFGYSLGVLHHVPDTAAGIASCVRKLKRGAPFLLYLYYRFDNRSRVYRCVWAVSNWLRLLISRLPYSLRYGVSQIIAALVYWPLARLTKQLQQLGLDASSVPLSYYSNKSFYVMRTDALDRFGTRLEQRFTREEIVGMMQQAGLKDIRFSDRPPYWCAIGYRA